MAISSVIGMESGVLDRVSAARDALAALAGLPDSGLERCDAAELLELAGRMEAAKSALAAAQLQVCAAVEVRRRAEQRAQGASAERASRGIAAELGLAMRISPHCAARQVGLAKALLGELPHTFEALRSGRLNEWRATLLARETAVLAVEQRAEIDRRLCRVDADGRAEVDQLGDRRLVARIRAESYRIAPGSVLARSRVAEGERRVTVRPLPDLMAKVTAVVPMAQGVAVVKQLGLAADAAVAAGDGRSRGQVMADTLVCRVTGQTRAEAVPVAIDLVVPAAALLPAEGTAGPVARLGGGWGPVPAGWARDLLRRAIAELGERGAGGIRRLLTSPDGHQLIGLESSARCFPAGLARLIADRDEGICRTPWCDAPIRHLDHVKAHAAGGPTSLVNGQGLCQACNHARQAPGWRARVGSDPVTGRHRIDLTSPTGLLCHSTAPAPPGAVDHWFEVTLPRPRPAHAA